jgi:hypothetical protein
MQIAEKTVLITGPTAVSVRPLSKKPSIGERKAFLRALGAHFQTLTHA